jgi:hypothetical protein
LRANPPVFLSSPVDYDFCFQPDARKVRAWRQINARKMFHNICV